MAYGSGHERRRPIAEKIKNAKHAGIAKKLSKDIASDEDRFLWEKDNVKLMEQLLQAKANQCKDFKVYLD